MPKLIGTKIIGGDSLVLDQEAINSPASMQEQTRGQVAIFNGPYGSLATLKTMYAARSGIVALGQNFRTANFYHQLKVRQMRKHPTIKLVRTLSCAGMAGAKWSVETTVDAHEDAKAIVSDLLPLQTNILSTALTGKFDWGWQPYEKIFYWDMKDERTKLRKLKPLLQDYTAIMVTADHGDFAGFKQFNKFLSLSNSLLLNQDVEASYLYGESTMSAIEPAYDRWLVTDASNVQYDRKISGAHWVVHYPEGKSIVNGVQEDNFLIAKCMLRDLEGSGSIAVPRQILAFTKDLETQSGEEAWKIEILSADSAQGSFSTRLQYLDTLMVRGGEFPERAILEGQYGTKAEAGEHADFAIARMDFRNKTLADQLNWHLANQLLRMNLGQEAENTAWISVAPIADDKKDLLKQVLLAALANPAVSGQQFAGIDMHGVREQLGIPAVDKEDEGDENLNNMLEMLQQQHDQEQMQQQIDPKTGQPISQPGVPPNSQPNATAQ